MFKYTANDLSQVIPQLPAKDHEFAKGLVKKAGRYTLTDKQLYWINELTKRAKGEQPEVVKPKAIEVGDLSATIALFDKAKTHLKYPKVLLVTPTRTVRLSVAGERSRNPGAINVASVGSWEERTYFGSISRDGVFQPTHEGAKLEGLANVLKAFAADPAKIASEYGRLNGNCCFCSLKLSDERSTAVGYGKTCAQNFGLPWGDIKHVF